MAERNGNAILKVEKIFEECIENCFITTSKNTGEYISAITLPELYYILCEAEGVDPDDTKFKNYSS